MKLLEEPQDVLLQSHLDSELDNFILFFRFGTLKLQPPVGKEDLKK